MFRFIKGEAEVEHRAHGFTIGQIVKAWSPFLILTVMVTIWSLPAFKALFGPGRALAGTTLHFAIPGLDKMVAKGAPLVAAPTPLAAGYDLNLLSATGTAILLAGAAVDGGAAPEAGRRASACWARRWPS